VLGACSLQQVSSGVHDQLLLGQGHLLSAVEQTHTEIRVRQASVDTVLSVDSFHLNDPGRLIFTRHFEAKYSLWHSCFTHRPLSQNKIRVYGIRVFRVVYKFNMYHLWFLTACILFVCLSVCLYLSLCLFVC